MTEPALSGDLEALDEFLLSDRAPPDSMGLSDLDGFLTGLVTGPETIMPSEWLPVIWGGEGPAFGSIEEAQAVLGAIMGRHNEIARGLDGDPEASPRCSWKGRTARSSPSRGPKASWRPSRCAPMLGAR